jgi:hypothetical protein
MIHREIGFLYSLSPLKFIPFLFLRISQMNKLDLYKTLILVWRLETSSTFLGRDRPTAVFFSQIVLFCCQSSLCFS